MNNEDKDQLEDVTDFCEKCPVKRFFAWILLTVIVIALGNAYAPLVKELILHYLGVKN